jgi:hypothetical protein
MSDDFYAGFSKTSVWVNPISDHTAASEKLQTLLNEVARDRHELGRWRLVARFIGEDRGLDLNTPEKLLAALHANQIPT